MPIRQGFGTIRTISADAPTQRSDGRPLDPSEIGHYNWYMGFDGAPRTLIGAVNLVQGNFTEAIDVDSQEPGQYVLHYTTVDTEGRESVPSNILTIEIMSPLAAPNPPSSVS